MDAVDAAHLGHLPRHRKPIQRVAVEVADHAACCADKMVVPIRVGIKPGSVTHGANASDDAFVFQQLQRPIDGINRDGRNPLPHAGVNHLGVRVLLGSRKFPQNLCQLMGGLDALSAAALDEFRNSLLDLFCVSHLLMLKSE